MLSRKFRAAGSLSNSIQLLEYKLFFLCIKYQYLSLLCNSGAKYVKFSGH